jgi:serine/threonine protein kinase
MGPDQLRGLGADVSWDLWAMAVMTYEMLAGALPFPGTTMADYQSAVLAGRVTPIRTPWPEAPERLDAFFSGALSPDPWRRPRQPLQFVSDLQRALD